jgi:3-methyladenine DNA glycosylase/8-oxoguanine DNA glycosylase
MYRRICRLKSTAFYDLTTLRSGYVFAPWWLEGDEAVRRLLSPSGRVVEVRVRQTDTGASVRLLSAEPLSDGDIQSMRWTVDWLLGVSEDLSDFYDFASQHPELRRSLRALSGYRLKATYDLHEALISAIISQNTSFQGFRKMLLAVISACGPCENIGDRSIHAFPGPEALARVKPASLLPLGLGYRSEVIPTVSQAILGGLDGEIQEMGSEESVSRLMEIKGIGQYTAGCALLYGLRRYDAFYTDSYVTKVFGELFFKDRIPRDSEIRTWSAERWGRYRGLALDLVLANHMGPRLLSHGSASPLVIARSPELVEGRRSNLSFSHGLDGLIG